MEEYVKKKNFDKFFVNFPRDNLPQGVKYSNKIMLNNALDQFLKDNFDYLVYSTADIIIPPNLFEEVEKISNKLNKKEFCALIYPNILKKNGIIKSSTTPHYGIDIFVFKLHKNSIRKFKKAIISWQQYDWGINDNFYTAVCDLLKIPIYNIYKKIKIIKIENDFETINENRDWQIQSWKKNQNYFIKFLKKNNLSLLYAYGSYHYLLIKIFRLKDFDFKLALVYLKFYLSTPKNLANKFFNFFNPKKK